MSEQHVQGTDAVTDLNNELKTRREKLANLREQGLLFRTIFVATILLTNCIQTSTAKRTKSWRS